MKQLLLATLLLFILFNQAIAEEAIIHLARYEHGGKIQYGQVKGNRIYPISGDIYQSWKTGEQSIDLAKVKLLTPTEPEHVFAVGMNYASHISSASNEPPPLFLKLPSSLIASGTPIKLPADTNNVHYEGEMVLIIGKMIKNASLSEAKEAIFAITTGNDLTERNWQGEDLQWLRAKASDGFGPVGPYIAIGTNYNNLLLTTRLNGKVVQQESTRYMIHKPAKVVSYLSRYFTLRPGDLIFMGTPGQTRAINVGDKISVSLEKVGVLENRVSQ